MNKNQGFDYLIKLIVIGDSKVGKTSFLLKFTEDSFSASHIATIGKSIDLSGYTDTFRQ